MKLSKLCVGVAACLGALAEEAAVALPTDAQCAEGTCKAAQQPAAEHLLLQVNHGASLAHVQKVVAQSAAECGQMRDTEKVCEGSCKVLATNMWGKSCADFCAASGFQCVWAAEEVDETCGVQQEITCQTNADAFHTSDLLCQCQPGGSGSGQPAPANGLVWSDEFDGNGLDRSKWGFEKGGGGFGNNELQHYTDQWANAHVDGGTLKIVAKCENYGNEHFTSAKLTTQRTATWGPGHRVEVRAKISTNQGSWPAIWMLPRDSVYGGWPKSGEMDIMEAVGCTPGKVFGTVHTEAYNHRIHTEKQGVYGTDATQWRVYSLDWEYNRLVWKVDGHVYHSFSPADRGHDKWPFDQQFYLILNIAVGGSWGGYCLNGGWPSCSNDNQFGKGAWMEVDYARVYKIGGSLVQEDKVSQ